MTVGLDLLAEHGLAVGCCCRLLELFEVLFEGSGCGEVAGCG